MAHCKLKLLVTLIDLYQKIWNNKCRTLRIILNEYTALNRYNKDVLCDFKQP